MSYCINCEFEMATNDVKCPNCDYDYANANKKRSSDILAKRYEFLTYSFLLIAFILPFFVSLEFLFDVVFNWGQLKIKGQPRLVITVLSKSFFFFSILCGFQAHRISQTVGCQTTVKTLYLSVVLLVLTILSIVFPIPDVME